MRKLFSISIVFGTVLIVIVSKWAIDKDLFRLGRMVSSLESLVYEKPTHTREEFLLMDDSLSSYVVDTENAEDGNSRISDGEEFDYGNERLYNAVIGTNKKNCMRVYNDSTMCQSFTNCKNISPSDCSKRLPKALIIGVFKAGTREFIDFFAMHPKIRIQRRYEIHFFSKRYSKGLNWYRNSMPLSLSSQTTIEKSPGYFASKFSPKRIHKMDPNIKLILLVREPVSRVISHFTFDLGKPPGDKTKFENLDQCVLKNEELSVNNIDPKCKYVSDSTYSKHLKNYLKYFNRDQIHIIDSVDFTKNPCTVLKQTEIFLGLEPIIDCNDFIYNEEKGFYCVADPSGKHKGVCYSDRRGRSGEDTKALEQSTEHLKPVLSKYFAPFNEEFYKMANRRFEW